MAPAVLKTLLLLTLGLEINFVLSTENKIRNGTGNLIESERNSYAAKMASYMNTKVDPCQDFYEYSCGNYFKVRKEKYGVSSTGVFSIVNSEMNEALDKLWSEPVATNITVTEKAKLFYKSCMKADIFQFLKADAYLKLIESLGGWPALDPKWKPENFDWQNVITTLASHDIRAFFTLTTNYGKNVIKPYFYGIRSPLIDKPFSRNFNMNKGIIMKILNMYGISNKKARQIFKEILQLGKKWKMLYEISQTQEDIVEPWTIDDLQKQVPNFDWDKYFESLLGQPIDSSAFLFVQNQNYFTQLQNLFTKKNARAAANYLFVKLLYVLHNELKYPQYKIDFCVRTIKLAMKNVVTAIYLNSRYHQESVEDEVMSMASYMRSAFKDVIKNSDWMDKETKRKALIKLRDMRMVIGDVELSLDLPSLEKYYEDVHITPENDFYQNNLIFRRHSAKVKYNALFNESYSNDAYKSDVNAFYSSGRNKMVLPAGILRKPFFILELPKSYNYGAMGAKIIGHEMTHGFDSKGRHFDENGKWNNWWSHKADEAFQSRAECFIKQYDSYTIPEVNMQIKGEQTLGENIADAGGVRQGYIAYQKWIKANEGFYDMSKETLPFLNLTNNQLFFLAYAQTYCSKLKRKAYQIHDADVHAVNKFRIIGSIANYDEFGKLFNCKLGTTMNPVEKCLLW